MPPTCEHPDRHGHRGNPEHILLTVLGTRTREAAYSLGGKQRIARLAPVALMDLLPPDERPRRVLAFCTNEAEATSLPVLEEGLTASVEPVSVPTGDRQEDIDSFLSAVAGAIPLGARLTVDMTHGFRHFAVLMYVAVLYVAELRDVRVRGAYYAMLGNDGVPSPFLDLCPLLHLPRWVHALKVISETGSMRPLANIVADRPDGVPAQASDRVARAFSNLANRYLSGLPLELGQEAANVRQQHVRPLKKMLTCDHNLPMADHLVGELDAILDRFAFPKQVPSDGWKRTVALTDKELKRQARVVDDLLEQGHTATGLGLMREWTINWAAHTAGNAHGWLAPKTRRQIERRLHAITVIGQRANSSGILTEDQHSLGRFWDLLRQLRNAYHHHGMRPRIVGDKEFEGVLREIRESWNDTFRSCPEISLALGDATRRQILVSPLGKLPGVLFGSLHAYRAQLADNGDPSHCIVVCSTSTRPMASEALGKAGYQGERVFLVLDDPFADVPAMEQKVKDMWSRFIGAEHVAVNVTGGTSLMGIAVRKLAVEARKLACPVFEFGLIDRRSSEDQRSDPYRPGEAFWLDSEEHGSGH